MTISVIGLGKLGLPILKVFKKYGYKIIGIDKVKKKGFTTSFRNLGDISFVIVPTPSLENNKFTSEYVEEVLKKIKRKHLVVIVSTLMPGETDRLQKKFKHLTLVYNPTFCALGSVARDFTHPDFVLIGSRNEKVNRVLYNIYESIIPELTPYAFLTPLEAEITKLSLNCYITTKITFANQIGNLCYRLGLKPDRILESIGLDSRIGQKYFKAGLGYGGTCFPRDNLALSAYCDDNNLTPNLFRTVDFLNRGQELEIVERVERLKPKTVGFKSLSFKEGTNITECSPLKGIYKTLKNRGYKVKIGKGEVNLDWSGII